MIKKDESKKVKMKDNFYAGKSGYVYRSIQHYNKEVKGARPEKICVGLISEDKNYFYPNKKYYELYPDEVEPSEYEAQNKHIKFGHYILFDKIINSSKLQETLEYAFTSDEEETISEDNIWKVNLVKDMASYMIKEEKADMQYFPYYCYDNAIFSNKIYSDSFISNFFKKEINDEVKERFLLMWSNINQTKNDDEIFICYDSTNFNSVSTGITLLEKGYAKDDKTKPQFNFECVARSKDGLPLVYDTFPGSIVDVKQCKSMIELLKKLGYKKITIVCDRGYISEENIKEILKLGYSFLFMVKDNLIMKKNILDKYADEVRDNMSCYNAEYDMFGKTYEDIIYGDIKVYHHVFYTSEITKEDRKNFYLDVEEKEKELSEILNTKTDYNKKQIEDRYSKYFDITFDSNIVTTYERNINKINKEYRKLSFYTIVTDKELAIDEVLRQYKLRDGIEKFFMMMKTGLGVKTFGTHSNESTTSKVFVCFVALIIRSILLDKTKEIRSETNDQKSYTVPSSLYELGKIEASVSPLAKKRVLSYVLTRKQKTILSKFDINENQIKNMVDKYIEVVD